jgi:isopenicillin N synthase-like dioxygenase
MSSIPTLDFTLLQTNRPLFLAQLRDALSHIGFLTLSNALEPEFIQRIFQQSKAFFDLPLETKKEIAMIKSPHFRGYSAVGEETTAHRIDAREQIDFGPETAAIPADQITAETNFLHLYGPNLFPDESTLPGFKETILDWRAACNNIAIQMIEAIGEAVEDPNGSGTGRVKTAFENGVPYARCKIVSYPGSFEDAPLGVGAHKDGGGLTLLLQDSVGGLQVQRWSGSWIDVAPNQDLIVVNIGQVL